MSPLKEMRTKAGLTQTEVANRLNIRQTTVSMWETGSAAPKTKTLNTIASLYGCSVDDLLKDVEGSQKAPQGFQLAGGPEDN